MMPHALDWVIPEQLGACGHPSFSDEIAEVLRIARVGLLINLHEQSDSVELLSQLGAETLHLPVQDFVAPTQEQLDLGVAAIREALGGGTRVAVHCGAGLGRTGTLLAAYLVSAGSTADEAISQVRAIRPGSVETPAQEQAVREFGNRLRHRALD
jgi:atypical dual specificity phosphatase